MVKGGLERRIPVPRNNQAPESPQNGTVCFSLFFLQRQRLRHSKHHGVVEAEGEGQACRSRSRHRCDTPPDRSCTERLGARDLAALE